MRSLIRNDVGAVPTAHEVLFRGRRVAHTKLRVGLALSLLAIWNSAAFAQMPPPTNPNLVRFGYYFVNEKNGDDTAYVWPYTNLYVAIPSNAAADGIDWQARLSEQLNAATVNHKAVYLILGECTEYVAVIPDPVTHQDCSQYYWDPILDVAQSYWGQVAYVEVAHEPYPGNMDTPEQMDTRISTLNTKLAARGLAARPLGAIFNTSQIQSTNAILASGLSFVNIEAYLDQRQQNNSTTVVVANLNGYLTTAKNRVKGAGKQIFLTGQAYDLSGAWTNMTTLEAIQRPVYDNAYADNAVIGIMEFAYNRRGGTKDHPELQQAHREIGSLMGLSVAMNIDLPGNGATVGQGFTVAGWAIDRAAIDRVGSSGHGSGVDFVVAWAWPTNGGSPTYMGVASYGVYRPDVGGLYGNQFTYSGFGMSAPNLTPGQYWIAVTPHSSISGQYMSASVVVVNVQ